MLSVATANLNTRIRNKGFSARELWTQCDQFTNEQLPLTDYNLIRQQHALRNANHAHSQLSKSQDGALPKSQHIDVGDIVYLYADRNKTRSRCRYIVVSTDGSWLNISKFIGTQLRATSYRVKRSECYKVVANTPDSAITQSTKTRSMRRYPTLYQSLYRAYQRSSHTRLYQTKRNRCSQLHNISL